MSAEVPQTPTPESRIEALQRLQSTIETLQELATALEAQPEMTVSESETKALSVLAEGLQPVAIVPCPPPAAKAPPTAPEIEIADVAQNSPATPSATPLPEPLPPEPAAVVPQPEAKPSLLERIFDRISLKFSLIAFAIGVTFIAILIKLLVFPFPKFVPPSGVSPTEAIAPATEVLPVSAKNDTPEAAIPTPTAPISEVPVNEETSQIVVIPSSNSTNDETSQIVVIPSSDSTDNETSQIVVIPSSNSTDEETSQTIVPSPSPVTEEMPSEPLPQVVTIVPESANEEIFESQEDISPVAEMPVEIEVPALPAKPTPPPETLPIAEPKAEESVPAVPVKPTPEQRFIASIQKQVTQTAQTYVADPSIESLNANFEGSLLQIRVADRWFGLGSQKQDQLAQNWLQQAQEFDFQTLEIVDGKGALVARSPVVGSQMVILKR